VFIVLFSQIVSFNIIDMSSKQIETTPKPKKKKKCPAADVYPSPNPLTCTILNKSCAVI
jgi:hypothetical protein